MDKNIRELVRSCQACQAAKINRHTKSPVTPFNIPSARFTTVHIDIVGPLPPATQHGQVYPSSYMYLLTCVDRTTRWVEAAPLHQVTAASVATAFLDTWVSRFGVPLYVITDRGAQFESELFRHLADYIGFHRLRTTSYHPQCNGAIERVHRTLKTAIIARKEEWLKALPVVLLGIRCVPNQTGASPFTAVTGSELLYPRVVATKNLESNCSPEFIRKLARHMRQLDFSNLSAGSCHSKTASFIPRALRDCTHVWVRVDRIRRPLEAPYIGPRKVLERQEKTFTLELPSGGTQVVSIDRLKPAVMHDPPVCSPVHLRSSTAADDRKPPTPAPRSVHPAAAPRSVRPAAVQQQQPPSAAAASPAVVHDSVRSPTRTRSGRRVRFNPNADFVYY